MDEHRSILKEGLEECARTGQLEFTQRVLDTVVFRPPPFLIFPHLLSVSLFLFSSFSSSYSSVTRIQTVNTRTCTCNWWKNYFRMTTVLSRAFQQPISTNWSYHGQQKVCNFYTLLLPSNPVFLLLFLSGATLGPIVKECWRIKSKDCLAKLNNIVSLQDTKRV